MKPYENMTFDEFLQNNESMKRYPNMAKYIYINGAEDIITIPWVARDAEAAEKIYKKAVESGISWREVKP